MNTKKITFIIVVAIATISIGGYLGVSALDSRPVLSELPKLILNPRSVGETVSLDISEWDTFQSEKLGFSLKYPKEWKLYRPNPTGYPQFIAPNDKCVITTSTIPTDPGQTVDKWFTEKEDAGGFHAELISKEFVKVANKRSILAKFAALTPESYERRLAGKPPIGPVTFMGLFTPFPKDDVVFWFSVNRGGEEENLAQECKDIFDIATKTLNLKETKI